MDFLLYAASLDASVATRSKMSGTRISIWRLFKYSEGFCIPLTNEFRIDIARLEIPVSGWTCLRTRIETVSECKKWKTRLWVDGRGSK